MAFKTPTAVAGTILKVFRVLNETCAINLFSFYLKSIFFFQELHPQYKDHPKFRNYAFDVREFMRLVEQAVIKVRQSIDDYKKHHNS